jgi:nucleotide-binding universal stress UspA family protein
LDYIDNTAIGMVIMGRRGIGRIGGIVVGGVSSKVSAHAHGAVLTVK